MKLAGVYVKGPACSVDGQRGVCFHVAQHYRDWRQELRAIIAEEAMEQPNLFETSEEADFWGIGFLHEMHRERYRSVWRDPFPENLAEALESARDIGVPIPRGIKSFEVAYRVAVVRRNWRDWAEMRGLDHEWHGPAVDLFDLRFLFGELSYNEWEVVDQQGDFVDLGPLAHIVWNLCD